ncbi:glycosyltransferase family 87 protein [Granulicella sp. dw_53]|uniref:glycosyltransferase family 87 protein n=1 Tax=Granulicella sp. dw_53 TaxID=2719792 RepID=UPI001BD693FD|nr:glycosyltransferase family 87 protein [Granulicella sp. dw_53]
MKPGEFSHGSFALPWITNAILSLLGFGLLAFTKQLIAEFHRFTIGFSGVAGWSVILYVLAVLAILTLPANRFTLPLILGFGIAFRLVTLLPEPFMSSDIYRYVWDGVVQHAHISPYRYVPGDPVLTSLRAPNRDLFDHINRRDYAHTIYPPVAQFLFYGITWLNASVTFMKLAMILFEGVTVYALMELLQALGRRREEVLLYVWCPLLIWEIGSSGHLDSAAMAFIALALLARFRQQPIATGAFLGAAILIKFYPLVLVPALWQRKDFRMPLTIVTLAAFSYACYASVGWLVFGFLGGYVQEEGMQSGTRYFFLQLLQLLPGLRHVSSAFYLVGMLVVFGALAFWSWKAANSGFNQQRAKFWLRLFRLPERAAFLPGVLFLAFAMMLVFSPHYPWYLAWLIPFGVLLPNLPVLTYALGLFYLSATPLGAGTAESQYRLNSLLYAAVFLAGILELIARLGYGRIVAVRNRIA